MSVSVDLKDGSTTISEVPTGARLGGIAAGVVLAVTLAAAKWPRGSGSGALAWDDLLPPAVGMVLGLGCVALGLLQPARRTTIDEERGLVTVTVAGLTGMTQETMPVGEIAGVERVVSPGHNGATYALALKRRSGLTVAVTGARSSGEDLDEAEAYLARGLKRARGG